MIPDDRDPLDLVAVVETGFDELSPKERDAVSRNRPYFVVGSTVYSSDNGSPRTVGYVNPDDGIAYLVSDGKPLSIGCPAEWYES